MRERTDRVTDFGQLARVLRAAATECDVIAAERAAQRRDWISQADSPIGRKRHCAAVRRRLEQGMDGAAIVGRRHLLSASALSEELTGARPTKREAGPDIATRLREGLRLVGGEL